MASVFIDGQAGTTGLEISERLSARSDIDLLEIDPAARKEPAARRALMAEADVTVLCLPDQAAREAVELGAGQTRFIDASTAHRTAPDWVYGCPELSRDQRQAIAGAERVSNPGCYPQGFILLIRPLLEAGLLDAQALLCVFGLSGYSGGGRTMVESYQAMAPEEAERVNTRPYALGLEHKHRPEMQHYAGLTHAPVFSPSVANYYRGMLIEIPLHRAAFAPSAEGKAIDGQALADLYRHRYGDEPFIETFGWQPECLLEAGYLDATTTNGTNQMQLMVFGNDEQFLLVARYDNLGKGASGAAVQNLNLMLGLEETLGLAA
ncbi:MAG: N-acetyl-gamma-glutamyl-phosphate reductase [Pseudomonadota bacterium]